MKIQKIQRRMITLIEIMIVMALIALIAGAIAYSSRGSLEEGKAFKTKIGIEKVETILNLAVAKDPHVLDDIQDKWRDVLGRSPLVQNAEDLSKDGWGNYYDVEVEDGKIVVRSEKYEEYLEKGHS